MYRTLLELQALVELVPALKKLLLVVPIISFRRSKNLKDVLLRVKLQPLGEEVRETFCCGKAT